MKPKTSPKLAPSAWTTAQIAAERDRRNRAFKTLAHEYYLRRRRRK